MDSWRILAILKRMKMTRCGLYALAWRCWERLTTMPVYTGEPPKVQLASGVGIHTGEVVIQESEAQQGLASIVVGSTPLIAAGRARPGTGGHSPDGTRR